MRPQLPRSERAEPIAGGDLVSSDYSSAQVSDDSSMSVRGRHAALDATDREAELMCYVCGVSSFLDQRHNAMTIDTSLSRHPRVRRPS